MLQPLRFFTRGRSGARASTLGPQTGLRVAVQPPSLRVAPPSGWQRLLFWLMAPAPGEASPPLNRLPAVRAEFFAVLADCGSEDADALRQRVLQARSLRELWHARAEVFRIVGVHHDEALAHVRLSRLDRHFPVRASASAAVRLTSPLN